MSNFIYKGFTGLAKITNATSTSDFLFRFNNCDVSLNQDVNTFLPSYGGKGLYRIVSPKVGMLSGSVSLTLCEGVASKLYNLAYDFESFDLYVYYRQGSARKYFDCRINQLSFNCKAGEMAQANFDIVCKTESKTTDRLTWTEARKIVTWDKTSVVGLFSSTDIAQSFSYQIENNVVVVRTTAGLLPYDLKQGIQRVFGSAVWYGSINPNKNTTVATANAIYLNSVTFNIDTLSQTHFVAEHWSYRTPLSPDVVVSTLEWTRVDDMPAPP